MRTATAIVVGLVLAVVVLVLGPKETVVCNQAAWPNSLFDDRFGHIDGMYFTGCSVPSGATWAVAGALAVAPASVAVAIAVDRRRRRPTRIAEEAR